MFWRKVSLYCLRTVFLISILGNLSLASEEKPALDCNALLLTQIFEGKDSKALLELGEKTYQSSATAAKEYLLALQDRKVESEISSSDSYGIEIARTGETPLNQLAKRIAPIDVHAIFNSCRRVGVCVVRDFDKTVLALTHPQINLTEQEISEWVLKARIVRDLSDTVDVAAAYLRGNIGIAGTTGVNGQIDIWFGRFQQEYKFRHLNRRQRRVRLQKDSIDVEGKDSKKIIRQIQLKERDFAEIFYPAVEDLRKNPSQPNAQDHVTNLVSHYLNLTGIPNRVIQSKGFKVEIDPMTEARWQEYQKDLIDGVTDTDYTREYPELMKFARIAAQAGYKIRFDPSRLLLEEGDAIAIDHATRTYYLSSTQIFSEFFQERDLLTVKGFERFVDFSQKATSENIEAPVVIEIIKSHLLRWEWLNQAKFASPKNYISFAQPSISKLGKLRNVLRSLENVSELGQKIDRYEEEFNQYLKLVKTNADPQIQTFTSLGAIEKFKYLYTDEASTRSSGEVKNSKTPYNTAFHPLHSDADPEFIFTMLIDRSTDFRWPESYPVADIAKQNLIEHPEKLFPTYLAIRHKTLKMDTSSHFFSLWMEILKSSMERDKKEVFKVLKDMYTTSPKIWVKLRALEFVVRSPEAPYREEARSWYLQQRNLLLPPKIVQRPQFSDSWEVMDPHTFVYFMQVLNHVDPQFTLEIIRSLSLARDNHSIGAFYRALRMAGIKDAQYIEQAVTVDSQNQAAKEYLEWLNP